MAPEHSVIELPVRSRYLGRRCPVIRKSLGPGDQVVVCHKKDEVFSWAGWPQLEGKCPFCGHTVSEWGQVAESERELVGRKKTSLKPPPRPEPITPPWRTIGLVAILLLIGAVLVLTLGVFRSSPEAESPSTSIPQSNVKVVTDTPEPATLVVVITATSEPGTKSTAEPATVVVVVTATPKPSKKPTSTPKRTRTPTALTDTSTTSNQITYACGPVGNSDVCTMDMQRGYSQKIVSHSADDTEPDWSSDGRSIVFQSDRAGNYDLFVTGADGTNLRNLTSTSGRNERGPDWSPDGSQIVYEVGDGRSNGELWVMDASGRNQQRLLNRSISGRAPTWSPDGKRVAFMRKDSSGYWQVYIIDLNTGQETKLGHRNEHCRFPTWSPNGRYIAYNTFVFGTNPRGQTYEVWRMSANGSGSPQRLTSGGDSGRPAWSSDGQYIIYNHGEYLYVMSATGSSSRRISGTQNGWAPDWSWR